MRFSVSDVMYGTSDCRRAWYLGRTWESIKPIMPFFIGEVVHKGVEILFTHRQSSIKANSNTILNMTRVFGEKRIRQIARGLGDVFSVYQSEFDEALDRSIRVTKNYLDYEDESPLEGEVVDIEKKFALPFDGFMVSGRIDLVLRRDDGLWIVDHKTTSSGLDERGMDLDEQVTAYLWAARRIYDEEIGGIIFNTIRSYAPEPPTVLTSRNTRRLSKAKSQPTTVTLFLEAIEREQLDTRDYEDILGYLETAGWDQFFSRVRTRRNEFEIMNFENRLRAKLIDLKRMIDDPVFAYPSPSIYRCPSCPFLSVCKSMEDGSDWEYQLENTFKKREW